MTTYPHNMEEVRHAEINDKGMMKCSKCPFGKMLHNMAGAYKCTNGIMDDGNYTYYGGCSLINNVKYGIATLYTTPDILVPTRVKPSAPKEIKVTAAKTGHAFNPGDYYGFDGVCYLVKEKNKDSIDFYRISQILGTSIYVFTEEKLINHLKALKKTRPDGNIFDGKTRLKDNKASWRIESKSYFPDPMDWREYKEEIFNMITNEGYTPVL